MSDLAQLSARDIRAARDENPKAHARDLAARIGISEAQLLAAQVGEGVTRINADVDAVMAAAERLGTVMALTRNDSCVHEKVGEYANYRSGDHASMVLNDAIDMRMFRGHWVSAFAVDLPGEAGPRRSLQVFDAAGDAVHKIHLRPESRHEVWEDVVAGLALAEQRDTLEVIAHTGPTPPQEHPEHAKALREKWVRMTDTHQFNLIVRKFKMNRLGAYRVAGAPHVRPLPVSAVDSLLTALPGTGIEVMVFVGNHGCIQIHGGPVETVKPMGPWINVLDPGFNLHLRGDHIAEVYEVRKPTRRGMAISVEAFDAEGGIILQIFGRRTDDADHYPGFTKLVEALPTLSAEVPA